jgi:hypothetical protein
MRLAAAVRDVQDQIRPVHHVEVEEAQRSDGLFEEAVRDLHLVAQEEQVLLDLGEPQTIGRAVEEQGETRDERDVRARGTGREIADGERLQHPLTQGSTDHDRSPFNEIRSVDSQRELRGEQSSTHGPWARLLKDAERAAPAASSNSGLQPTPTRAA